MVANGVHCLATLAEGGEIPEGFPPPGLGITGEGRGLGTTTYTNQQSILVHIRESVSEKYAAAVVLLNVLVKISGKTDFQLPIVILACAWHQDTQCIVQ